MKNYITILILFSAFSLAQEASTGNILEDHDKAVEGILSDEIKKQTEIINKSLAKQSNDVVDVVVVVVELLCFLTVTIVVVQ